MKRILSILLAAAISLLCSCKEEIKVNYLEVNTMSGEPLTQLSFKAEGESHDFIVKSGGRWMARVEGTAEWYRISTVSGIEGESQVTISAMLNKKEEAREASVSFVSLEDERKIDVKLVQEAKSPDPDEPDGPDEPDVPVEPQDPTKVEADLLDVVFNADGTAKDISASRMDVQLVEGTAHMNYHNDLLDRNVAHFNQTPGSFVSGGFYRVNYSGNPDFIKKLKDGHSIEIMFSTQQKLTGDKEVKMFASHESGGLGFLMSKTDKGNCLTYLPYIGSGWAWTKSNVNPEPGRYYHAVGVWDKNAGKSYVYVDGVLKGAASAKGELKLPNTSASHWFGIGVDATAHGGQAAWYGDVAIARIYDQVLTKEQVAALYDKVKVDQPAAEVISLTGIQYLGNCTIPAGYKFHIFADGFKAGDKVTFKPVGEGKTDVELGGELIKNDFALEIPSSMESGKYTMILKRGNAIFPLGSVTLTIGPASTAIAKTKCVAHRCYHENGYQDKQYPENSLAAFKRTEELGVWGAEIDVYTTTDGQVVVNHNYSVPTDPQNRKIEEHSYEELSDIRLSNGEPLPKLESFLKAMTEDVKTLNMVLEIKSGKLETIDKCTALIKKYGLEKRVAWIAFSYDACKRAHAQMPDNTVMYLGGNKTPEECHKDGINGIDYADNVLNLNPDWISKARELGMVSNVWTVNSAADMMNFIGKGVDFITTDEPVLLKEILSRDYITK